MPKSAYVHILASHKLGTLYTGVTSDIARRLDQPRGHVAPGFTSKYGVSRLVWYAHGEDIGAAIALEKKIKNRGRQWKVDLIEQENPGWDDLAPGWLDNRRSTLRETPLVPGFTFRIADPIADRAALISLNVEHVTWVFDEIHRRWGPTALDVLGATPADYVPTIIDKVCGDAPPRGVFHLVEQDGALLGMGGLRHSEAGVAEMKRVFVRPAGRGRGLGEAIATRLVADARAFGYRRIRLDTLPFMGAAQALYERMGFVDCAPYPIEMPEAFRTHVRYMELAL